MEELSWNILAGENVFEHLDDVLSTQYEKVFFLVDENTHEYCLPIVLQSLTELKEYEILEVPAGEESKCLDVAANLWRSLNDLGATRDSLIINVGGGMITDLGGFVASTYKRGIGFIHVPTSLLAMVDAAIGGKTGVDLDAVKNLVGTFHEADYTLIYPPFIETLPQRETIAGFAEVVKHGLLDGQPLLDLLLTSWHQNDFETLIMESARVKIDIVEEDFDEGSLRKVLNFGHTLGHAVESYFLDKGQAILHGEAIAAGILMESWLSMQHAGLSSIAFSQIVQIIRNVFPDLHWPEKDDVSILYWLQFDKKNEADVQQYALLQDIGDCTHGHPIAIEQSAAALAFYRKLVANNA